MPVHRYDLLLIVMLTTYVSGVSFPTIGWTRWLNYRRSTLQLLVSCSCCEVFYSMFDIFLAFIAEACTILLAPAPVESTCSIVLDSVLLCFVLWIYCPGHFASWESAHRNIMNYSTLVPITWHGCVQTCCGCARLSVVSGFTLGAVFTLGTLRVA